MMNNISRTGLVPTPKKERKIVVKRSNNVDLSESFEALPIALSLRQFGGLLNPFAKGCSVLCNHPAPAEIKQFINQCKHSLTVEGKKVQYSQTIVGEKADSNSEVPDNIPEDLFRRYTDSDSRPLTPTPTVTSIHTRTSAGSYLNTRRCITPDLENNELLKRKKIILDLRRSHSQETLYWKPFSDLSSGIAVCDSNQKTCSAGAIEEKKARKQKLEEQHRPKSSLATSTLFEKCAEGEEEILKTTSTCINEETLYDGNTRRGKRRKKFKPGPATATFHISQDPETQIATLGPDSLNPSTRPSIVPNAVNLLANQERRASNDVLLKGSFLTTEAFQTLKTKVDVALIENTFDIYLNTAYREAYKYLPSRPRKNNDVSKELEKLNIICEGMPRKLSKSATRFEVPIDPKCIEDMCVIRYLSEYVWISDQCKQIFKKTFLKYLEPYMEQELPQQEQLGSTEINYPLFDYQERYMDVKKLDKALKDVLEFYGTEENINRLLELINYKDLIEKDHKVNFRCWCGIVAFAERLALQDLPSTDSCDELEIADFNSMELRIENIKVSQSLKEVFQVIQKAHSSKI